MGLESSNFSFMETSENSAIEINEKMDRENFYHWGATREIMEIIRRRVTIVRKRED